MTTRAPWSTGPHGTFITPGFQYTQNLASYDLISYDIVGFEISVTCGMTGWIHMHLRKYSLYNLYLRAVRIIIMQGILFWYEDTQQKCPFF